MRAALFRDPRRRERRPELRVATAVREAEAVGAVGEDVNGMRDPMGGERPGEAIGVLGWDVWVLGRMP